MINLEVIAKIRRAWIFGVLMLAAVGTAGIWIFVTAKTGHQSVAITLKPDDFKKAMPRKLATYTVARLEEKFQRIGYNLQDIRQNGDGVPRVSPDSVPSDMDSIRFAEKRKDLFIGMMLPLVLLANERLEAEREKLLVLIERINQDHMLETADRRWLDTKFTEYKVKDKSTATLLRRLDIVPPSLAVAQAAIESGWGTSRFAREGNALYGQWTWGEKGIVPENRDMEKRHKIKSFSTPLDSVISYIRNLNTHQAYRQLRELRFQAREKAAPIDGAALAIALTSYSEKGMEYVDLVRLVIRVNELHDLDKARLVSTNLDPSRV